jgi:uncharacterized membrane protein YgaE (UPF0421/DUF939 family)
MKALDLTDLGHRTLWTFLEAFLAMLIAAQVIDLAVIHAAGIAAIAAALVPIKEYARAQLTT